MTPVERRERRESLRQLLGNFGARGATAHPRYLDALRELDRLESRGLDLDRSEAVAREAARRRGFASLKMLAEASGVDWQEARYAVGNHLDTLNRVAHGQGLPMVGAVVVAQENLGNGRMAPRALEGFMATARDLGRFPPGDDPGQSERAFLEAEQRRVFEWAAGKGAAA